MTLAERTPVVARVWRGAFVESEHRGIVAVADASGRLIFQAGDPTIVSCLRSSAKPFQLLPLLESGAADHFGFTAAELAVMAGSHAGRPEQVGAVRSVLMKAGLSEDLLRCGAHMPFDGESAEILLKSGQRPSVLHNNCSGKHAGMLALAAHLREPLDTYLSPGHAVQAAIRSAVAWACGIDERGMGIATDGCSAPTFFVPVVAAATAFARLAAADGADGRAAALMKVREAMTAHPEIVSGPGRFDTAAMAGMPGLCSKGGAEGFQGLAVRLLDGRRVGVAVKIWDGSGRAAGPVALEALKQVAGALPSALEALRAPAMKNYRDLEVGRLEPVVTLVSEPSPA